MTVVSCPHWHQVDLDRWPDASCLECGPLAALIPEWTPHTATVEPSPVLAARLARLQEITDPCDGDCSCREDDEIAEAG